MEGLKERERARFESKIYRSGGPEACHPWIAYRSPEGYGQFGLRGKVEKAHRVAFFLAHGRWPQPCGCHSCDNRACCNDRHMFEGTNDDNVADKIAKGREYHPRGSENTSARLSERDVVEIRTRYALPGMTQTNLAREFGVSQQTISKAINGKLWGHVGHV